MALITSHTLNGVDGSHAGGIAVSLHHVAGAKALLSSCTDEGGRLSLELDAKRIDPMSAYELVFETADYWRERGIENTNLVSEIVLRFHMENPHGRYHMPIILSPFSYSTWKSG